MFDTPATEILNTAASITHTQAPENKNKILNVYTKEKLKDPLRIELQRSYTKLLPSEHYTINETATK